MAIAPRLLVDRVSWDDALAAIPTQFDPTPIVLDAVRSGAVRVWISGDPVKPDDVSRVFVSAGGLGWIEPARPRLVSLSFGDSYQPPPPAAPVVEASGEAEQAPWDAGPVLISIFDLRSYLKKSEQSLAGIDARGRPGPKTEYDWEYAAFAAGRWWAGQTLPPRSLTPLVQHVTAELERKHGHAPDESRVRKHLRAWLKSADVVKPR